jgi:hypothetical protein
MGRVNVQGEGVTAANTMERMHLPITWMAEEMEAAKIVNSLMKRNCQVITIHKRMSHVFVDCYSIVV